MNSRVSRFSPWDHPIKKLRTRLSGFSLLRETFNLTPFEGLDWPFLKRDKKREALSDPWTGLSTDGGSSYNPIVDDRFAFSSMSGYNSFLNDYRTGCDFMLQELKNLGCNLDDGNDVTNFSNVMSYPDEERRYLQVLCAELDIARRFTIQRRTPEYYYVNSHTPNVNVMDSDVLGMFKEIVKAINKKITDKSCFYDPNALSDPVETNSGSPFFKSGPEFRLLNLALFAGIIPGGLKHCKNDSFRKLSGTEMRLPTTYADRLEEIASLCGIPAGTIIGCGSNKRTGPSRKSHPLWKLSGNDLIADHEIFNDVRGRQVFMAPCHYNMLTGPSAEVMTQIRKNIPGFYYDKNFISLHNKWRSIPNQTVFETDFSGMDRTFSVTLRTQIIDCLKDEFKSYIQPWMFELLKQHAWMPYLIPDFSDPDQYSSSGIMCSPKPRGVGLYSGIKATSAIDSMGALIFLISILPVIGADRNELLQQISRREALNYFIGNQGDDVIVMMDSGKFNTLKVSEMATDIIHKGLKIGFKVSLFPGDRFLMKHYNTKPISPVLSRIIQQTFSNEHIRKNWFIYKLGAAARTIDSNTALNFIKNNCKGTKLNKLGRSFYEFYYDMLGKLSSWSKLSHLFSDSDGSNQIRQKEIVRLSTEINNDEALKEKLATILSLDRFSSSTSNILDVLSQHPALMNWFDVKQEKANELYLRGRDIMSKNRDYSKFRKIIKYLVSGR